MRRSAVLVGAVVAAATLAVAGVALHDSAGPADPGAAAVEASGASRGLEDLAVVRRAYPWHHDIVATTFWVGEVFEPGPNGSQVISAFDDAWMRNYGGCDGQVVARVCRTERRVSSNGFFPRHMTPQQNPFYLDLPFDDVNDPVAAAARAAVVPWARDAAYRAVLRDPDRSLMKNRWVEISYRGRTCFGQIEDAGPGEYHDAAYVFGSARPVNRKYGGAGMDVSPALTGCLGFSDLDGETGGVSWRFVESPAVPAGPWLRIVTVD